MRSVISALLGLISIVALGACTAENGTMSETPSTGTDMSKPIQPLSPTGASSPKLDSFEIVGTVRYKDLEGGFYAIDTDDGKKYDPVNLPESFRKDGLRVTATVRLNKDLMSFRMYGEIIEIEMIETEK